MQMRDCAWVLCVVVLVASLVGCRKDKDDDIEPTCTITAGILDDSGTRAFPVGMGGEGDLRISTDVLTAVFARIDRPAVIAASGGTLVDLYLNGRDDHMNEYSQLAGAAQALQIRYTEMEVVEQEDRHVVVESRGFVQPQPPREGQSPAVQPDPGENMRFVTRWEIRCGEPKVRLHSELVNVGTQAYSTSSGWGLMDVMMWGTRSLEPFCPVRGQGDRCQPFEIANPTAGLVLSPYVGATGSLAGQPGTFAFYIDDPTVAQFIGVHDDQVSAFGFPSLATTSMAPGQSLTLSRVMVLGDQPDVASAADLALDALDEAGALEAATVTGRVVPPAGEMLSADANHRPLVVLATPAATGDPLDHAAWHPHTMVRVRPDGTFTARTRAGAVAYEVRVPGRQAFGAESGAVAHGATLELGDIAIPPAPELRVSVRDGAGGPVPARVIVVGKGDTPSPHFGSSAGGSPALNVALTDGDGDVALNLPAGTYDVYATHGPFWSVARQEDVVVDDGGAMVALALESLGVVPDGFISADLHVHSAASFDSSLPINDRVRAFLAEGVDAIVATEHDIIFDYAPALATVESDLPPSWRGRLRTFVGLESTASLPHPDFPNTIGHHNAFPLTVQQGAHKNGAPMDEFIDVGTLYERLRGVPSPVADPLVQLNHPRASRSGSVWLGYFDSCGFDPTTAFDPLTHPCFRDSGPAGTRPFEFDAMEVINGARASGFLMMARDWYALLRQWPGGPLPVGTANADSHRLVIDRAGYPVNLLRTDVALGALDDATLVETLRSGAVAGSLGVFAWVEAAPGGTDGPTTSPGQILSAAGEVDLHITVRAAPWIPVDEVRILAAGEIIQRIALDSTPADPYGTAGVARFDDVVTVGPFGSDTFITIEAGFVMPDLIGLDEYGRLLLELGPSPEPLGTVASGAHPLAFTNPIFIDTNGDGVYTPINEPLPPWSE
jgi:hypothetical protein